MCERIRNELDADATVVATGGLSGLIGPLSTSISHVEPWLTLHGLRLIFEKNQGA
jgi:type III pantothenate kinase